ncbi:MAG: ATP-binding protein [Nitrospinaceae bacterium]
MNSKTDTSPKTSPSIPFDLQNVGGVMRGKFPESFHCQVCGGQGYLLAENERGISTLSDCECAFLGRRLRLLNEAGIPGKFAATQLETYHPVHASQRLALRIAKDFVDDFGETPQGLVFMGKPGLGKTHLAASILKALILDKGVECRFVDFFQLLSDIRHGYSTGLSEQAIITPYTNARVLVIDELAKGRNTDWEQTMLDQIISNRYNAADRVTLFTTNFTNEENRDRKNKGEDRERRIDPVQGVADRVASGETLQERLGERIYSRLMEMCRFVHLEGEDYRPNIVVRPAAKPRRKKSH